MVGKTFCFSDYAIIEICNIHHRLQSANTFIKSVRINFKGQLISEQICGVLNFQKMQQNIARISALASKMGQIEKSKGTLSEEKKGLSNYS